LGRPFDGRQERNNDAVIEIVEIADRGHTLPIDHGWREVCDRAREFIQPYV
jgi:non-heme chloroperoxidase